MILYKQIFKGDDFVGKEKRKNDGTLNKREKSILRFIEKSV